MKIFVETDRIIMRELIDEDVQGMFALDSDPEVHRYLGNSPITTLQEAADIIKFVQQQYIDNGIGRWAIIDKATNDFIGWSGLKYETDLRTNTKFYDLGYRLRRKYWGQGIATETARESLKYGFNQMDLEEISAHAYVDNAASNKIIRNVGFSYIDTFPYYNTIVNWYTLKRSDWMATQ